MRLKIVTSAFLLFGLSLLAAWPWTVGARPPKGAPRAELVAYLTRFVWYLGGTVMTFVITAFLAIIVMRRAREAYRAEARQNLEELLEGTRQDHARKHSP